MMYEGPLLAPAVGVIVVGDTATDQDAARLNAELRGRIAVGTQTLIIDVEAATNLDAAVLWVLADAATLLQAERSGTVVLRNATAALLRQLRLMRLDHVFELEI